MKTDYDALGLDYDPPVVRVDRFEEALHVIKQCFTGETFSYNGSHYRITDYASYPKPVQATFRSSSAEAESGCSPLRRAKPTSSASTPTSARGAIGPDATKDSLQAQTDMKLGWVREPPARA